MENLELSLSSLSIISNHAEKSRSELSKYLAKQIWTQQDRQCILNTLAHLLLDREYTLLIGRHLRPIVLDLLERNAEIIKADGRINHDLHERLCVAMSKLLEVSPDALPFALRYFTDAPPVFQRLFLTTAESAAIQYGRKRMKLRDLMGATLRFLQSDCARFRDLWDWSVCMSLLRTTDVLVRWYTAHCLAMVSHMTDKQKTIFLKKIFSNEELLHHKLNSLEEAQQLGVEKALILANPETTLWRCEKSVKYTRGQVVSGDLSRNVVAVCGVVLPKKQLPQQHQGVLKDLVLVDSTCQSLQRLAMAVASQNAVLLEGPIGCGKTALVEYLAAVTGHVKPPHILKVQLGDQTDSKMLLGMYRCTDIPGEFVWQPGTLTQAVSNGYWILLEDIDYAPLDVISVLIPLLENGKLLIPGRGDCIEVAPGFQFFATRRLFGSAGGWYRQQNTHAALLDKHWTKIQLGNMSRAELKEVVLNRYPSLAIVVERLLDIYCQLTGDKHLATESLPPGNHGNQAAADGPQPKSEDRGQGLEGRGLSLRDLLKWCERIFNNFDSTCSSTALNIFLEALDCFTAMLSKPDSRQKMAEIIGSKLNISKEKAEHFCQMYKPGITFKELEVTVGRATVARIRNAAVTLRMEKQTFAATRPSSVLLEQLSVCVNKGEPVLLVGETGTGKTSTVQYLASIAGLRIRVVNMNQQSDTADLLGGYKPVDHKLVLLPLREAFEDLFSQTFSRRQNSTFLGHVQSCFREKRWQDLLKLMDHVCKSAVNKEPQKKKQNAALLKEQWEAFSLRLNQAQQQIKLTETALVFAFVEGTLAQAVKKGEWILLDEINLAAAETLECLSGLLEGSAGSLVLLDRGDTDPLVRHPDFRLFACMNPATDVGKRNLPPGIRNRFTELYVEELENEGDLRILISDYLKGLNVNKNTVQGIISFYLAVRKEANARLVDGTGHRPHYSLRTLCRALRFAASNPCHSIQRSLYEGFSLSFLTQLDRTSHPLVQKLICLHILNKNTKCLKQPIPEPPGKKCIPMEGYWIARGEMEAAVDSTYILTPSVKLNLRDLARVVSAGTHPVLIQGETSVGKTSLIKWLAAATGNQCVRINNHEHTDIQEYIGCYASDTTGKLVFREGVLIDAMRKGYWIILDELNLAPTDVLEALNRLLDDNRELFITETQEVVKAHPRFMLFATQNPPGLYGGRKVLSRAFRNRFVELHFDELPSGELESILHKRCSLPPSYSTKLVRVMLELQSHRRGSTVFAGKHGFITLRDLFRWAERYRLAEENQGDYDWLQHLANDGFMLLAGRVRKPEEAAIIQGVLEKHFKKKLNPGALFSQDNVSKQFCNLMPHTADLPEEFRHIVWTHGMRRLAVLVGRALAFGEPVLLVGDTGCGKTTICQLFAALSGQKFYSLNCHLHMETSDFLGGLRPVRHTSKDEADGENTKLFEWHDGPLVSAMKEEGVFLMDEISLADDSVLERLNSVLETEKTLVLAEKGSGDNDDVELIAAGKRFRILATMNPGGDFGKKELSPALRNRFTEIWCPQSNSREDLVQIIKHNLRPGISLGGVHPQGKDVADVMLDFIDWLMAQEFGRRCILSVRDILSWVHFQNLMTEAGGMERMDGGAVEGCALRLDPVSAFVHAACLVYIDGIGSGTTFSAAENALSTRRSCLNFLCKQLSRVTTLDDVRMNTLRIYETRVVRKPLWGENYFGIHPFYIPKGPLIETSNLADYALNAGTTAVNAQRLLRALKLNRPVLLEGSPGVGKTSLVAALAKASGNHLVRINLSEQSDVTDLFGTDLPVEGGRGGEFAWRDGPLLAGLKAGHWIVLDELNLASQSVLEGLNACFDHRAEIYVPELGMSFQVQHEKTKIFGCQNPFTQGGGRKGLPKSFLNRFTQVYVDQLSVEDMEFIGDSIFPDIDKHIIAKMVQFNNKLVQDVMVDRKWGQRGGPWEFNLRDLFRWCQLMQADQSPGFYDPGQHVGLVYADRMRTQADKTQVLSLCKSVFGDDFTPYTGSRQFHITPQNVQVGFSVLPRGGCTAFPPSRPLSLLHRALQPLESVMKCVEMGWMTILVGPAASGKTSLVQLLSLLTGHRLKVMAMNSAMDTTELLGGFEQVDIMRPWQRVLDSTACAVAMVMRRGLLSSELVTQDTEVLLQAWSSVRKSCKAVPCAREGGGVSNEAINKLEAMVTLLQKLNLKLKVFADMSQLVADFKQFKQQRAQAMGGHSHGTFEWIDGMLVQALQAGDWLLMDNVNFCSPSVLDRLNALLEPGGVLTISERGVIDGTTPSIKPHPNFRLFLTMDPVHGEVSRAMRNRGVEIYIPGESEGACWDLLDVKTVLHGVGVKGDSVCNLLLAVHTEIKESILGSPTSSVSSLLQTASLLTSHLQRGLDLPNALRQACEEAYILSQRASSSQKLAREIVEKHLSASRDTWGGCLLSAGLWPDAVPSALHSAEDSCFATVQRDGQVLTYCLNRLSLSGKGTRPLSLSDLRRVLQCSNMEGLTFPGESLEDPGIEELSLVPAAVRLITERASNQDWVLRTRWLSHMSKCHKHAPGAVQVQLEAGARALTTVFSSKLRGKLRQIMNLIQPPSADEFMVLVDQRWNMQYLDILTTSYSFDSEGDYRQFLEALISVANRVTLLMDREEQMHVEEALLGSSSAKKSIQSSALRMSTAFRQGRVDYGNLPHPVLAHIAAFFELWDPCVMLCIQTSPLIISDDILYEVLSLLLWRDRFWTVSDSVPGDSQGIALLALHWHWVQKHLICKLPQMLMGENQYECLQEVQSVTSSIDSFLSSSTGASPVVKIMQKALGKPLPFKEEAVAECASRLRGLSSTLDVMDLRPELGGSRWRQEIHRLEAAASGLSTKRSLLEAWGLILQANYQLEHTDSGNTEKLQSIVDALQSQITSRGLLPSQSKETSESDMRSPTQPDTASLRQLSRRIQLWPVMEYLAVLCQYKLVADLLEASAPRMGKAHPCLSPHIDFCLQSTPTASEHIQGLCSLLHSDKLPPEQFNLLCSELVSGALSSFWRSSVSTDPHFWLTWNPLSSADEDRTPQTPVEKSMQGPGILSRAVWSKCFFEILTSCRKTGRWDASGVEVLSSSRVTLGEWRERTRQLQDVNTVLWTNMAVCSLADFSTTDCRLQAILLHRQLLALGELLPSELQEEYVEYCDRLTVQRTPAAMQYVLKILRDIFPAELLPEGFVSSMVACVQQSVRVASLSQQAQSGSFWVNMGLVQIQVWTPRTIFDPAVKKVYKLNYAQEELKTLQSEWRARSLSSELLSGHGLEEEDGSSRHLHPRIRFLWSRMQQLKEQIAELSRKQACRPQVPQYERLYQEVQHYCSSIAQPARVQDLLSRLLKTLQEPGPKSRPGIQSLLNEEAAWQTSQHHFTKRLAEDYPLYPDVVNPLRAAILQMQHGMRLVASEVSTSLASLADLPALVSCLLSFPSLSPSLPSYLARAERLCSRASRDVLRSLSKLLPAQEQRGVIPEPMQLLLNGLLYLQCHVLSRGGMDQEALQLFRHICQAIVNEWDEQERRAREREIEEASLYRHRSRQHGTGLSEEEEEEREFRRSFPRYNKDFADITSEPSLEQSVDDEEEEEEEEEEEHTEPSSLSPSCMQALMQIHQRLCLGYSRSLWYRQSPAATQTRDYLCALVSSYQTTAPLMARFYHLIDSEMNEQLSGSQLLLSSLIQNTVSGGETSRLLLQPEGPYDFYQHPNIPQARQGQPALEEFSKAVRGLLQDWPEHPALLQLLVVIDRILSFPLSCPLAKFLNGLEILLAKAQDWEENASRSVSLRKQLEVVTQLIIQWRKLELNCWSGSLDNALKRHREKSTKHWFSIYQLVETYLQEQKEGKTAVADPESEEVSPLSSITGTLQAFIEGATVGEFHTRLVMLLAFHCHVMLIPEQEGKEPLSSVLWNLYTYYQQFSECVQAKLTELRRPIEKELKDFVKISKWNDVSFWSIKQSVEKTHRTLFKFVKKFEAALNAPSRPALMEQGDDRSLDCVDQPQEETPVQRLNRAVKSMLTAKGKATQVGVSEEAEEPLSVDASSLQGRLPLLTGKMKKMCVRLMRKSPLPELVEDLDQFTAEVISNVQELQNLTVDRAAEKEKQKSEVKHILQQKQRALSGLFKLLAQIGLSYRKGLAWTRTADPEETLRLHPLDLKNALSVVNSTDRQENMLFAEMAAAWNGCQKYFYRSLARRVGLQAALLTPAKELGLGNVERCKGFTAHLLKLLVLQRRRLSGLTEQWVQLRKLFSCIQEIQSRLSQSGESGAALPPQDAVLLWTDRTQTLAMQCMVGLEQLSWVLQCCPEDTLPDGAPLASVTPPEKQESGLRYPSPLAAECLPAGCCMRRGDQAWQQLTEAVAEMLTEAKALKAELDGLKEQPTEGILQTWSRFEVCSSGLSRLGAVAARLQAVETLFTAVLPEGQAPAQRQPAVLWTLQYLREEIGRNLTQFTAWKTELLTLKAGSSESASEFLSVFSDQVESAINSVLCAIQSLVKRKTGDEAEETKQLEKKTEQEEEATEDLIKPGHLTKLLEEELSSEVSALSLQKITASVLQLLETLKTQRETCTAEPYQVFNQACFLLVRLLPMLASYTELVQYYLTVSMATHRSTGKLLSVLANMFTELAQKGFCLPKELMEEAAGEGATEFHDYEGGGIGEGEGKKDVSDKIEDEEQVEDTFQQGQEKKEEDEENKPNIEEEDNAIEMTEDFDGKMHDGDRKEPGEDDEQQSESESEEELDKQMGNLGEGEADKLDERLWGDEDDDEDEGASDKEEESGQGMDEGESELVAKDDNLDAGNSNKEDKKQQDKDEEPADTGEGKEKIHEQLDEREYDENEVDPYHGNQEKQPEAEAMDLPEDLNLDNEEDKGEEQEEEENPFEIEEKPMETDDKEEKEQQEGVEGQAEESQGEERMEEEVGGEHKEEEEEEGGEHKEEEEEGGEHKEDGDPEEEGAEADAAPENKEEEEENEAAGDKEEKGVHTDQGQQPKGEEASAEEDKEKEFPESAERKQHEADGQTGEENLQSDSAVELAGAASERDQAKEEHGSGAADASQSEGHESKLMARVSSQKQTKDRTQSFKRKPGQADNERSTGDYNERIHKRLRTVEAGAEKREDRAQPDGKKEESDVYEHVKEGAESYDAQTYDVASAEQQKPAGAAQEEEEENEGSDVAMETEEQKDEDLQAVDAHELKPEQNKSTSSKTEGVENAELELQPPRIEEEEHEKEESQNSRTDEKLDRPTESTVHTVPELLMDTSAERSIKDPEELRKELEQQLDAWQKQQPGNQEEERAAAEMWQQYQVLTSPLSQQLCEQLRLILEPTRAAKLKGDFRTGKRLNMRKVIPYIASQFRKDKIWLRRTKPSKREYQICLAVDDSSSMIDNHSKQLAFESLSVIGNALALLEVGQISVCSFGETVQLLHPFHEQFNDQSGARILRLCKFQQKKTKIAQFLESAASMFVAARQQSHSCSNTETAQLLLIVSDGRGLFLEGKERVTAAVQAARNANIFVIFVVLDNPNSRDSILDIKVPIFKGPGEMPEIRSYMEEFPFPFYMILRDVNALPETLSDALRQWFELVAATDQ
ncbi:midasin isoform X1 [Acipenser ruthenus]|uniref:midasin isoform X1 n=1 Tax=Acipenser ruthenus TaxID=7906 RepID=UPI002740A4DB|nr:midasin isoform X1 [Acipenser ruthenus]